MSEDLVAYIEKCNSVDEVMARLEMSPDDSPEEVRELRDLVAVALDRKARKGKTLDEATAAEKADGERQARIEAILAAADKASPEEAESLFGEIKVLLGFPPDAEDAAVVDVLGDRAAVAKARAKEMDWVLHAFQELGERLVHVGGRTVGFIDPDGNDGVWAFLGVPGSDSKQSLGRFLDRNAAKQAILAAA